MNLWKSVRQRSNDCSYKLGALVSTKIVSIFMSLMLQTFYKELTWSMDSVLYLNSKTFSIYCKDTLQSIPKDIHSIQSPPNFQINHLLDRNDSALRALCLKFRVCIQMLKIFESVEIIYIVCIRGIWLLMESSFGIWGAKKT